MVKTLLWTGGTRKSGFNLGLCLHNSQYASRETPRKDQVTDNLSFLWEILK